MGPQMLRESVSEKVSVSRTTVYGATERGNARCAGDKALRPIVPTTLRRDPKGRRVVRPTPWTTPEFRVAVEMATFLRAGWRLLRLRRMLMVTVDLERPAIRAKKYAEHYSLLLGTREMRG